MHLKQKNEVTTLHFQTHWLELDDQFQKVIPFIACSYHAMQTLQKTFSGLHWRASLTESPSRVRLQTPTLRWVKWRPLVGQRPPVSEADTKQLRAGSYIYTVIIMSSQLFLKQWGFFYSDVCISKMYISGYQQQNIHSKLSK